MSIVRVAKSHESPVHGPAFVKTLFDDTRLGWLWLPLRLYAGYVWIESSSHKVFDPAWVTTGDALKQFWLSALKTDPKPVIDVQSTCNGTVISSSTWSTPRHIRGSGRSSPTAS